MSRSRWMEAGLVDLLQPAEDGQHDVQELRND
jgi:hypothetical protein